MVLVIMDDELNILPCKLEIVLAKQNYQRVPLAIKHGNIIYIYLIDPEFAR